MKKIFGFVFLFIFAYSLISCENTGKKSNKFAIDPNPIIEDALKNKKNPYTYF